MVAYTYTTDDGSYSALRLEVNAPPSAKLYNSNTPAFDSILDLEQRFIWQLGQWRSLMYAWRHRLTGTETHSYLLIKSAPNQPPPDLKHMLPALQSLVNFSVVQDRAELERILQPPQHAVIAELRQGSAVVELAAGQVIGENLGVMLPFMIQPQLVDWQGFRAGLGAINAETVISTLLIPTRLNADERAECLRLAAKTHELSDFSLRGQSMYDEVAARTARVYNDLVHVLDTAYFAVLQVASASQALAQTVIHHLAATWILTTTNTTMPSGFTLHHPRTADDLAAAQRTWTRLKYTRWDASPTAPKLDRLPYLMNVQAASALVRLPRSGINARIGKGDVILVEDNSKNININNSTFQGNVNLGIDSTFRDIRQTVGSLPKADEATKQQLDKLLQQLADELKQVPASQQEQVEVVTEVTQELMETASKPEPKKSMLEIKGKNLREAAENLKAVAPVVVEIAGQIVAHVIRFGLGT